MGFMKKNIKISIPHFYCLEYEEDGKILYLDIDFRESNILIGKSLIKKWEAPYDHMEITDADRERIHKNIKMYLISRFSIEKVWEVY